jgi:hypothetical protein
MTKKDIKVKEGHRITKMNKTERQIIKTKKTSKENKIQRISRKTKKKLKKR